MSDETADTSTLFAIANALGYLMGLGSLMLYTPIAIRLYRQKSADGTTLSTWMMKVASYTCNDLYYFANHYPFSTYIDTFFITVEASIVFALVVLYQHKGRDPVVWIFVSGYCISSILLYLISPPNLLALSQLLAVVLNSGALVPQFLWNLKHRTKGDYSPITTLLAAIGCSVRLWTVRTLADNDIVLLGSFAIALFFNVSLLLQILYYGTQVEGLTLLQVLSADVAPVPPSAERLREHGSDVPTRADLLIHRDNHHHHHDLAEFHDHDEENHQGDNVMTTTARTPSRVVIAETSATFSDGLSDYEMATRHRLS